jgi:hypothetical protein
MKDPTLVLRTCCLGALALSVPALADNDREPAMASTPVSTSASAATSSGPGSVPIRRIAGSGQTGGGPNEPTYSVGASWVIAGYNDNEVIYSIIITNQDQHIIRCSTQLSGYYLDNGAKHAISDRQGVTIFPGKQSSAGRWVGMDQASGATYKVTCRAVS